MGDADPIPHKLQKRDSEGSDSDSNDDPFTEDLDQIGRFNIPNFSAYITRDSLPSLSSFPSLGNFSSLPNFSNLPNLSSLPNLPQFPTFKGLSSSASLRNFDLAEVSRYISQYVNNVTSGADIDDGVNGTDANDASANDADANNANANDANRPIQKDQSRASLVNSVKTAVAMRLQMTTFLSDLKGGQSFQAAIARLQPITQLIHEAIMLPADDESEEEGENLDKTEPVGVDQIVNREQPFVHDPVIPEAETIRGLLHPTPTRRFKRKSYGEQRSARILSDGYGSNTDWDNVEELTREEAEVLTHLDSLDDFLKEDMLRQKIQRINAYSSLSQHLKNKLVTKLMMGNYYKYMNERIRNQAPQASQASQSQASQASQGGLIPEQTPEIVGSLGSGNTSKGDAFREDTIKEETGKEDTIKEEIGKEDTIKEETGKEDTIKEETGKEDTLKGDTAKEYSDNILESDDDMDEVALTEADIQPTFHNHKQNILGCLHYQRNCKLECPTCLKWYTCRFCHDSEISDHKLSRSDVKHILCMKCNVPQVPDTAYCVNCEEELANYFCLKCVLYDNDPTKDIYHCDKCGICRLGLGLSKDYFHCDTCNICLSIDLKQHHKCVSNTTHCNCPICNEYLFTSVHKVVFMKCGHLIHEHCYDEMIKHSYKCPICKKTVVNTETQFRILDQEIRQLPLPSPYDKWRCIISCNDCKGKSNCAYHVMGLKCRYCASYNTNQLKLIKPEEADYDDEKDDNGVTDDEDDARITLMRLMKTNLGLNFKIDEQIDDLTNGEGMGNDDSAYEGDANSEASDPEDDDMAAMLNMKRIKRAVLGQRNLDRTSILKMFQNFINATIMDGEGDSEGDSEGETQA